MKSLHKALENHYGIEGVKISPLISYSDSNYAVTDHKGNQYILKKFQLQQELSVLLQCEVLEYLKSFSFPAPIVVHTVDNNSYMSGEVNGEPVIILLLTFLEGKFLADITEWDRSLIFNFGLFMGRFDKVMMGYSGRRDFPAKFEWNLVNLPDCRRLLKYIEDVKQKRLIYYYIMQFEDTVLANLHDLRQFVIHNDPNPLNILVAGDEICGIIDFGDLVVGPAIFNVAIAITYLLFRDEKNFHYTQEFIQGYHNEVSLNELELDLLYYLVAGRLCNSLCLSSKMASTDPGNEYTQADRKRAWNLLEHWVSINPIDFSNKMRKSCGKSSITPRDISRFTQKRSERISQSLSTSYEIPIYMTRASMQYMYDDRGNTYLDCVNNICHVGHCHPVVVATGRRQMNILNTNTRYYYDSLNEYAEKLLATFPEDLSRVFFVNSGSAAVDLACRMATIHTNNDKIAVLGGAYHGNTLAAFNLSPYKYNSRGGPGKKDYIRELQLPDTFRGQYRSDNAASLYANELKDILKDEFIGAFIAESLPGCAGQILLPKGYLKEVYKLIHNQGGICIADEVQVGFGRVGEYFWGFELYGVVPDIVILGKPMGNGHPIGAVVCTEEICHSFENGIEFFSSFGGNSVSCEIGKAVLDVIDREALQQHALSLGTYLLSEWKSLKEKYTCIGDVRGKGLFLGMEIVDNPDTRIPDAHKARRLVEEMKKRFILLSTDGSDRNVVKFKPPMVFDRANADFLNQHLSEVFASIQ